MRLAVENMSFSYGTASILKHISLEVGKKEFIGIIGPNGSGKSTLLKCLYRVLKPSRGAVYLDGEELSALPVRKSARKLAVVGQHHHSHFEFTVQEVVLMGRSPHKTLLERDNADDYQIVKNALEQVGMEAFLQRDFSSLSGGEQQRVILARALAQQTPGLILDEPTNHLDITYQLQLMKLVKELSVTVITALHDLNIAAAFCDRIFVLKNGELIAEGPPKEVLTPKLCKDVYGVDTEVVYDGQGNMHILFIP